MECSEVMNTSTNMVPMISGGSTGAAAGMDWYVWLSRAGLDRATAYEYALVFAHNELDEDDIPHLDHGFLLSMGVSVGKHRLQILQLAQRDIEQHRSRRPGPRPVVRLLSVAGRARSCLARCLRSLAAGGPRWGRAGYSPSTPAAALAAAQRDLYLGGSAGGQYYWRSAVLKREKKLALLKQGRLTLTDGGIRVTAAAPPAPVSPLSSRSRSLSPSVYGAGLRRGEGEEVGGDVDKYFWSGVAGEGEQEMRWDSMFGNLKPT